MTAKWHAPIAFADLARLLADEQHRRELTGSVSTLLEPGESCLIGDPEDPSLTLVARQSAGRLALRAVLGDAGRPRGGTAPIAAVLPDTLPNGGMVCTEPWPDARFDYLDPDLRGPLVVGQQSSRQALLDYLGRVFVEQAEPERSSSYLAWRYVEPGVGRSTVVDFLSFGSFPEFVDFTASGVGRSPYCRFGYLLPGSTADGGLPLARAHHRRRMAELLAAAGIQVPRTAAIIELPGRVHAMANGNSLPAGILVRGFRCVLRVKQLDPLANLMMSRPWWRRIQRDARIDRTDTGILDSKSSCSCFVPSVMFGSWPGRRCDPTSSCFQYRRARISADAPKVLSLARTRLTVALDRDPVTELLTADEYAVAFARILGNQLAGLKKARVLHDYRALHGPWADVYSTVNSLGDTNVSLAGELADLDTAVAVDDPTSEDELFLDAHHRRLLARQFDRLHKIEVTLASGIARTVALIAGGDDETIVRDAGLAFNAAYRRRDTRLLAEGDA